MKVLNPNNKATLRQKQPQMDVKKPPHWPLVFIGAGEHNYFGFKMYFNLLCRLFPIKDTSYTLSPPMFKSWFQSRQEWAKDNCMFYVFIDAQLLVKETPRIIESRRLCRAEGPLEQHVCINPFFFKDTKKCTRSHFFSQDLFTQDLVMIVKY